MTRQEFFTQIGTKLNPEDLAYVHNAYFLVKEAHRRQNRRMTGERYFEHVRRVAFMASEEFGYSSRDVITLGLLHDVIEDTFVPPGIISSLFGVQMYHWCVTLSKELPTFNAVTGSLLRRAKVPEAEYYAALAEAHVVPRIIKGCDRADNLADFEQWEPARQAKYDLETRTYVLPIIDNTDARIAAKIRRRLDVAKQAA